MDIAFRVLKLMFNCANAKNPPLISLKCSWQKKKRNIFSELESLMLLHLIQTLLEKISEIKCL